MPSIIATYRGQSCPRAVCAGFFVRAQDCARYPDRRESQCHVADLTGKAS